MLRPNFAMDAPPTEIMVGGVSYAANTDYRVWLQVLDMLHQWRSEADTPELRQQNARLFGDLQVLIFGGVLADEDPAQVMASISEFLRGYPSAPMEAGENGPEVYSFNWDLNEIIIAIRNQSGRDISYRCEFFHWWEFLLEFHTLCGEHYILNLMEARGYKGNDAELLKRKRRCALPVEHTADEKAASDEINALFFNAQ